MGQKKIAAGIVLYNPEDQERVEKCIAKICSQTEHVYLYDNSTEKIDIVVPGNTEYMGGDGNRGLAYALNRIMEKADADGYVWVVTMDQDSLIPASLVEEYLEYTCQHDVGVICPQVVDVRRAGMGPGCGEPCTEYVDFCITSASCISVEIWKKVGKFDEWLFVDLIDNDFCRRVVCSDFKIMRINNMVLDQEFGKITPKTYRQQRFWVELARILHNKNIAKLAYKKYVSPLRVYYSSRNIIYVNRKLKKYGPVGYKENYNCHGWLGFLFCFAVPSILRAQDKCKVTAAFIKGTAEGLASRPTEWIVDRQGVL